MEQLKQPAAGTQVLLAESASCSRQESELRDVSHGSCWIDVIMKSQIRLWATFPLEGVRGSYWDLAPPAQAPNSDHLVEGRP